MGKINRKIIIVLVIAFILFDLVLSLCAYNYKNIKTYIGETVHKLYLSTVDVSGMEISAVLLDEDKNQYTNYEWHATEFEDQRTLTYQVNYKKTDLSASYKAGDLEIEVDNIFAGFMNLSSALVSYMSDVIVISADINYSGNSPHYYDWSYKYSSDKTKIILYNNNEILANINYEGSIQISYVMYAATLKNNTTSTFSSVLNSTVNSNPITIAFDATNDEMVLKKTRIYSYSSYDGLPEGDYTWFEYDFEFNQDGGAKAYSNFHFKFDLPEGSKILYSGVDKPINDYFTTGCVYGGIVSFDAHDPVGYLSENSKCFGRVSVGIPSSVDDNFNFKVGMYGNYYYGGYLDDNLPLEKILEFDNNIDLSKYKLEDSIKYYITGRLYDNNYDYSLLGKDNGIIPLQVNYELKNPSRRTLTQQIGSDVIYIKYKNGVEKKLSDEEFGYETIIFPGYNEDESKLFQDYFKDGNWNNIKNGKYLVDLYVRYENENNYTLYESFNNSGKIFENFPKKVCGYYFTIHEYNLSMSMSTYSFIRLSDTNLDIDDVIRISPMMAVYNDNELISPTALDSTSDGYDYVHEYDLNHFGTDLKRTYYSYVGKIINCYAFQYANLIPFKNMNNNLYYSEGGLSLHFSDQSNNYKGETIYALLSEGLYVDDESEFSVKVSYVSPWAESGINHSLYRSTNRGYMNSDEFKDYINQHMTFEVINNWNDSDRQMLIITIDLNDDPLDLSWFKNYSNRVYYPYGAMSFMDINFKTYINSDSLSEYGKNVALESFIDSFTKKGTAGEYGYVKDSYDVNGNGDTEEYLYRSVSNRTITTATESSQSLKTTAKTDKDNYGEEVNVSLNNQYTYKLRARSGANKITNMVIYDSLEKYIKRDSNYVLAAGENNYFQGTFKDVDTSFAESQGYTVKVYYSENDKPGSLSSDTSWKVYNSSTDKSKVKSLAFEYLDGSGNKAVLPEDTLTYVEVIMRSPSAISGTKYRTYNGSWVEWNALDSTNNIIPDVVGINSNVATVSLPAKLIVKHYLEGQVIPFLPDEVYDNLLFGKTYTTSQSDSLPPNYVFYRTDGDEPNGTISKGVTEVNYYYKYKDPIVSFNSTRSATEAIDHRTDAVTYSIKTNYSIEDYIGTYGYGESFTFHYEIDLTKSDLDGGTYDSENNRVDWHVNTDIDSVDKHEFETDHTISVVYKNVPISDREIAAQASYGCSYQTDVPRGTGSVDGLYTTVNEKYKITVKHLEDGTNNVIAPEETYYKYYNEAYEYGESSSLPGNYKLKTRPDNYKGNVLAEETVITYLYEKKTPVLTSESNITGTSEIDNRTKQVTYNLSSTSTIKEYIGTGKVTEVLELPYVIDISKSLFTGGTYDAYRKTITWTKSYSTTSADINSIDTSHEVRIVYKNIPISARNMTATYTSKISNDLNDKSSSASASTEINEKYKITVKHLDKENRVVAPEETYYKYYNESYEYGISSSLPGNYQLKTRPDNYKGYVLAEETTVTYVYEKKTPVLTNEIIITGSDTIDSRTASVTYKVNSTVTVKDYLGYSALIETIQLPYEIDTTKSNLAGGTYDKNDKEITWIKEVDVENVDINTITTSHEISIVYKNIPISVLNIDANYVSEYINDINQIEKTASKSTEIKEKYKITVKHLEYGTNKEIAPVDTYYKYYNESYEVGESSNLPGNYKLKTRPDNYKGTVKSEETVVIYLYEKKNPNLTSNVSITSTDLIEHRVDPITYSIVSASTVKDFIGSGTITDVIELPYEIDLTKSNLDGGTYNNSTKKITWTTPYETTTANVGNYSTSHDISLVYKNIPIDVLTLNVNYISTISNELGTMSSNKETSTEIKEKYKIIVKHLEYGTNKVLADNDVFEKYYNESYEVSISEKLPANYKLKTRPSNYKGNILAEETIVTYLYEKKTPVLMGFVNMTGPESIENRFESIDYKISYSGSVKDLIGEYSTNIVVELPYEIDIDKSNVNGGTYNSSNKTITWNYVDSTTTIDIKTYNYEHNIKVTYKNVPISAKRYEAKVTSVLNAENTSDTRESLNTINVLEKYKLVVKHLQYETNKELATQEEYFKLYGEEYETSASSNVTDNYTLKITPSNYKGTIKSEVTEVVYYYEMIDSDLITNINVECPEVISEVDEEVNIKITYKFTTKDYLGESKVIINDVLPYDIDESKSDLDGGTYDSSTRTITWEIYDNIEDLESTEKEYTKGIKIVFLDAKINEPIINNISGSVTLENNSNTKETSGVTDVKVYRNIIVKYLDIDTNEEISEKVIFNDLVGSIYTPVSKNIDEYTLVERPTSKEYIIETTDQTLTYKYKKRIKEVVQEEIPKVDENPSTGIFKTYYLLSIPIILLIMVVIRIGKHSMFKKYS